MDGYPANYLSFKNRLHRWIRGDTQILLWLKNKIKNKENNFKKNPLNLLSKYKIFDNLIRSNLEISIVFLLFILTIINFNYKVKIFDIAILGIVSIIFPTKISD